MKAWRRRDESCRRLVEDRVKVPDGRRMECPGRTTDAWGMAVSGTVPAPARTARFDPARLARWIRRATWISALAFVVWMFASFGTKWVPAGMDTVPTIPAGSWCVVDHRRSSVKVGSDVFFASPDGPMMLSRVTALDDRTVTVQHPNAAAAFPDSRVFGPLPRERLLGTVLVALPPDAGDGRGRGR